MKLYKCRFSRETVVIVVALLIFVFHLFDASVAPPDEMVSIFFPFLYKLYVQDTHSSVSPSRSLQWVGHTSKICNVPYVLTEQ